MKGKSYNRLLTSLKQGFILSVSPTLPVFHALITSATIFTCNATFASEISDRLLDCRAIAEVESRVKCYDAMTDSLMPEAPEKQTNADNKSVSTNIPVDVQIPETIRKIEAEDLFGKDRLEKQEIVLKELDLKSIDQIRSLFVKAVKNAQKFHVVYLENGQVWQQKKGYTYWRVKRGDVLVITNGSMGSFRMSVDGKNKSVGAKRLK